MDLGPALGSSEILLAERLWLVLDQPPLSAGRDPEGSDSCSAAWRWVWVVSIVPWESRAGEKLRTALGTS